MTLTDGNFLWFKNSCPLSTTNGSRPPTAKTNICHSQPRDKHSTHGFRISYFANFEKKILWFVTFNLSQNQVLKINVLNAPNQIFLMYLKATYFCHIHHPNNSRDLFAYASEWLFNTSMNGIIQAPYFIPVPFWIPTIIARTFGREASASRHHGDTVNSPSLKPSVHHGNIV